MPTTTRETQAIPGSSGQQESTVTKQHVAMRGGTNHTTTTLPSPSRHLLQFFQTDNDHDVSLNIYRGRRRRQHEHQQRYTFYYEPYQHSTYQRRHRDRHASKSSPLFPNLPSSSPSSSSSSSSSYSNDHFDDEQLIFHSDIMDDTAIFDQFTQLAATEDTFIPSSPSTTAVVTDDDFVLFP